ncbi:MAG: ASKHA domain-containing protein [Kiritimatiellia bacterium]
MPLITFRPSGKSIEVPSNTELLDAARQAGVEIDAPCGGKGTCGKCLVRIRDGHVDTSSSLGVLTADVVAAGHVLACRTRLGTEPLTVEVPEASGREGMRIAGGDETALVRGELLPRKWEYEPMAMKWLVRVPLPQLGDGLSDLDRLTRSIQHDWGPQPVLPPLSVLRALAAALRAEDGIVTTTLIRSSDEIHLIRVEPGDQTARHFGVAVDVGTTTIAVQLVDLTSATILGTRSDYNEQVSCGLDVISRINYARRPERLEELRTRALHTINRLLRQVTNEYTVAPDEICNAVISGNTTMLHLLLGLNPEYIRLDPYTPTLHETPYLTAVEVGLKINPESWVCFSPCVGSYVGGDITAGLLCTDLATETEQINLFIDIGTNGELVIGNRDFLMTCACSAGPAFEGAGIECGMRAAIGAIERVEVDAATGLPHYWTIDGGKPKGICGSGMIALLADLLRTGWIDASGKLDRTRPSSAIRVHGRHAYYLLAPLQESGMDHAIQVSELDIENIIRAKAAIYAACALLLRHAGIAFTDLANIYIGGGFGRFLNIEKAIVIGLLPDLPREKFHYVGNSSLMGSYIVLVSQEYHRRQLALARRMTYIDLSSDQTYMDQYTAALFLPHTDRNLFPSVTP